MECTVSGSGHERMQQREKVGLGLMCSACTGHRVEVPGQWGKVLKCRLDAWTCHASGAEHPRTSTEHWCTLIQQCTPQGASGLPCPLAAADAAMCSC